MTQKKYTFYVIVSYILLLLAVVLLSKSYGNAKSESYERGYKAGMAAADSSYDDYEHGYADAMADVEYEIENAYQYASDNSQWSVYEAWNNILIYNDGVDPHGHPLPTDEEYRQSIETLVYFCMYMDDLGFSH